MLYYILPRKKSVFLLYALIVVLTHSTFAFDSLSKTTKEIFVKWSPLSTKPMLYAAPTKSSFTFSVRLEKSKHNSKEANSNQTLSVSPADYQQGVTKTKIEYGSDVTLVSIKKAPTIDSQQNEISVNSTKQDKPNSDISDTNRFKDNRNTTAVSSQKNNSTSLDQGINFSDFLKEVIKTRKQFENKTINYFYKPSITYTESNEGFVTYSTMVESEKNREKFNNKDSYIENNASSSLDIDFLRTTVMNYQYFNRLDNQRENETTKFKPVNYNDQMINETEKQNLTQQNNALENQINVTENNLFNTTHPNTMPGTYFTHWQIDQNTMEPGAKQIKSHETQTILPEKKYDSAMPKEQISKFKNQTENFWNRLKNISVPNRVGKIFFPANENSKSEKTMLSDSCLENKPSNKLSDKNKNKVKFNDSTSTSVVESQMHKKSDEDSFKITLKLKNNSKENVLKLSNISRSSEQPATSQKTIMMKVVENFTNGPKIVATKVKGSALQKHQDLAAKIAPLSVAGISLNDIYNQNEVTGKRPSIIKNRTILEEENQILSDLVLDTMQNSGINFINNSLYLDIMNNLYGINSPPEQSDCQSTWPFDQTTFQF